MPDKKLPAVPETILKRRKRQAAARAERAKAVVAAKKVSAVNMNNFDFIYLLKIPQRTVLSFPIYIQCQRCRWLSRNALFQTAHAKRKEVFQRAEKYVKQYREKERDELRLKREAKKNNG